MHNQREQIKKKYKDLLTLLDFGYSAPVSFCCATDSFMTKTDEKREVPCESKNCAKFPYSDLQNSHILCDSSNSQSSIYSFGCGDPVSLANLQKGERLLDLGCGCGVDTLRAARILASKNTFPLSAQDSHAIGIDMLPEMLARAQNEAEAHKIKNALFLEAYMEDLPFQDNSFDVIISNCVINLSPNKSQVFKESYRVLKKQEVKKSFSSSRVLFSDIVSNSPLPKSLQEKKTLFTKLWSSCMGGVIMKSAYKEAMEKAGFRSLEILHEHILSQENILSLLPKSFHPHKDLKDLNLSKIIIRAYI